MVCDERESREGRKEGGRVYKEARKMKTVVVVVVVGCYCADDGAKDSDGDSGGGGGGGVSIGCRTAVYTSVCVEPP